ncbi:MAG TPA: phasin family protein [Vineibacter sp.]|nr:phasin family protein [Vineibacter sp.]
MSENLFTNPGAAITDAVSKIPAAARDFVQRSAATAKGRVASAHAGAGQAVTAMQDIATVSVSGSALVGRTLLEGAYQNVESTLGMIEKLAGAKCLGDAVSIQLDFVRDYGKAQVEQVRKVAGVVTENFANRDKAVRGAFAKAAPEAPAA